MHSSTLVSSSSFWQSNIWKNILLSSHQAEKVEIFSYDNQSILIEFRSVWLGMIGAFSLGIDHTTYSPIFFEKAGEFAKKHGAIFWKREDYFDKKTVFHSSEEKIIYPQSPYKHFLEPYTHVIDLEKDESTILSYMHEKWRYNIRLAEKRWVNTSWIEPTDANLDIWMNLLADTTLRDGFSHNSRSYYENFLENLSIQNMGWLLFAYFEWQVIAGGIFVYHWEDALYYYWASVSDKEMRKHKAPCAIQWEAIREWKRRWCLYYDFLWVSSPFGDDDGHLKWVTDFKEKFWWELVHLGEKIYTPLSYKATIFSIIRTIKVFLVSIVH